MPRHSLLLFELREHVQNSVSESLKVPETVSISFQYLNLVVAPFGKAIGKRRCQRIHNAFFPVKEGSRTPFHGMNSASACTGNPFLQLILSGKYISRLQDVSQIMEIEVGCKQIGGSFQHNVYSQPFVFR